jgi:hypothetical protein
LWCDIGELIAVVLPIRQRDRLLLADWEAREREQQVVLELSNAAGDYNNQTLELRLERQLEGVSTPVP